MLIRCFHVLKLAKSKRSHPYIGIATSKLYNIYGHKQSIEKQLTYHEDQLIFNMCRLTDLQYTYTLKLWNEKCYGLNEQKFTHSIHNSVTSQYLDWHNLGIFHQVTAKKKWNILQHKLKRVLEMNREDRIINSWYIIAEHVLKQRPKLLFWIAL